MLSKLTLFNQTVAKQCFDKKKFSTTAVKCFETPVGHYRLSTIPGLCTYGPRYKYVNFIKTVIWTHIFYTLWYQPEWLFGHKPECPKHHTFTDEELGIPPIDYDEII